MPGRIKDPNEFFNRWLKTIHGKAIKNKITSIQKEKSILFFKNILNYRGKGLNVPQRFRIHLRDFILYDVPGDWFEISLKTKNNKRTEKAMYFYYGPAEGKIRWEKYCKLQSTTNTFEYKKKKYKWNKEQFILYNKSRSVTLDNLETRYGKELGKKKFDSYCLKQKDAGCSLKYFKKKYGSRQGLLEYKSVNKRKGLTLDNLQIKYGKELGKKKFDLYWSSNRRPFGYSKISQELFWSINNKIKGKKYKIYFAELNKEFGIYDKKHKKYNFFDFVIPKIKYAIEYNGDHYHGNPKIYKPNGYLKGRGCTKIKAKEKWKEDKYKINLLKKQGYDILIVWDSFYRKNKNLVVERIVERLNGKNN